MKLTRAHAYAAVAGAVGGGALVVAVSGWGLVAVVMGVALGALAGVSVLAIGQWVLGQVMSEPYQQ